MKILVIAPHPDDDVLGCGGTIVNHIKNGDEVHVCFATKAYGPDWSEDYIKNKLVEINNANEILGITKAHFLDFPTVKLDTIPQKELNDSISAVLKKVQPDILYIPHKGDINKDHRLIFESTLVAARPLDHIVKRILSYEVLSETDWGQHIEPFIPNVYIDITNSLESKIEAMKAYASELKEDPHPRSLEILHTLAKKRGSEVGMKYSEAFILIREVIQ